MCCMTGAILPALKGNNTYKNILELRVRNVQMVYCIFILIKQDYERFIFLTHDQLF